MASTPSVLNDATGPNHNVTGAMSTPSSTMEVLSIRLTPCG
jgi:hypothetical protein